MTNKLSVSERETIWMMSMYIRVSVCACESGCVCVKVCVCVCLPSPRVAGVGGVCMEEEDTSVGQWGFNTLGVASSPPVCFVCVCVCVCVRACPKYSVATFSFIRV